MTTRKATATDAWARAYDNVRARGWPRSEARLIASGMRLCTSDTLEAAEKRRVQFASGDPAAPHFGYSQREVP